MTPRDVGLQADDLVASHRAVGGGGPSIKYARTYAGGTSRGAVAVLRAFGPRAAPPGFSSALKASPLAALARWRKMSVRKMLRGLHSQNFGSGQGLPLVKTLTQSRGLWARQGSNPGSGESFFWDAFFAATGRAPQTLVWGWSGAWPGVANGGPRGSVGRATFFEFHSTEPHSTLSSS